MWANLLWSVAIIALVVLRVVSRWKRAKRPPGPFPWPFVGNQTLLRRLTREFGGQHLAVSELCLRYRSNVISLRLGNRDVILVSGVKPIYELLSSENFDGRPWNEFVKLRNMGMRKGITMNDGPEWKDVRAWVVRAFRTVGFGTQKMLDLIKDELSVAIERLNEGGVHRLKPVIAPVIINVLWTLATGERFCEGPRLQYFMDLMERRARVFDMAGGLLSTFPWIRYIAPGISGYNLLMTLNNELKGFLMTAITEHKKTYVPGNEKDLIDKFLRAMYVEKASETVFTDDQLVMILMDLFIAGSHTTTTTLDFLFMNMVIHQDVQRKLQKEIDTVIGRDRLPALEDRPRLPYTEAVLSESQRMWTVTPIIGPRRALCDTDLDGYTIPKNTSVLINVHSVHRDPNLYPDPDQFKPERFLKDGDYHSDENVIFFGKGRRRCPGETLARSALFLIFVGIMQKYQFLPVPGQGPTKVEIVPGLTIAPKPFEVLLIPR